ncbi:MAG: pyruvate kinase [Bacteroidales bacterium]|nr:pyruvate kinase [Lentimicrobiaceae bacterium]MDD5696160.1 pyruvate kinase [Bacteroidales bacterium]
MRQRFLLTKVIATLGPASESPQMIRKLIAEGVDAFRLNFSHGSLEMHGKLVERVRQISAELDIPVAIIGDLSGPKIRIGEVPDGGILLNPARPVEFVSSTELTLCREESDRILLTTNYPEFISEVQPGHRILLDDGAIALECKQKTQGALNTQRLICRVLNSGLITSRKGVNLPDTDLSVQALTEKDHLFIEFAVEHHIDFLALSFVRTAKDIQILKKRLSELNARPERPALGAVQHTSAPKKLQPGQQFIPVISKIEKPQALANLEEILRETDMVMVARGDLGVEVELAEVAVHQKRIIHLCHEYGIPVIVATQMLQSMIGSPSPTRAEVSDVANAIFDGSDAVMLSGETAVGKYPLEAVRMMNRITEKTNHYLRLHGTPLVLPHHFRQGTHESAAIAHGVKTIVEDIDIKMIITWTHVAESVIYLSQYHIPLPILGFSNRREDLRKMALLYGLMPMFMELPKSGSQFIRQVDQMLIGKKWARAGDAVVFVLGEPIGRAGISNRLVVHILGDGE